VRHIEKVSARAEFLESPRSVTALGSARALEVRLPLPITGASAVAAVAFAAVGADACDLQIWSPGGHRKPGQVAGSICSRNALVQSASSIRETTVLEPAELSD
jgi:hypothetical protein